MKTIETKTFIKLSSDLKDFPTIDSPDGGIFKERNAPKKKKKKKKNLYQLNRNVEDISINELRGRG